MGNSNHKRRFPVLFFFGAFLAIVVVMFVARSKSALVDEIHFPFNNGIAKLSTYKNSLVAISRDNKIYVWDWKDLSKKARTGFVQSEQAALLEYDLVVSLRQQDPKTIVVTNVQGDKRHKEILIDSTDKRAFLGINHDSSTVAILLAKAKDDKTTQASYEFLLVDCDLGQVEPIVKLTEKIAVSRMMNLAVSDDGAFIVGFGEKNNHCWIVLVDVKQKQVVWEKEVPELRKLYHAIFSPAQKVIYARGSDSTLYKIEVASGKVLGRLLPIEENKNTLKSQHAQTVTISPDGHLVAATVFGAAYVWNCQTEEKIFGKVPNHKLVSSLAFSPDNRFLATSDLRQGGTIKIWRMPGQ